ncbi:aminopeptidase [Bacillus sp. BGMRC 2118]|nr:aminopeptidase [Bacillus sp. BGMRC 2118]
MKTDFQRNLEKYANLIVKFGVNVQKGQGLLIRSTIDAREFVRAMTKLAYEAGASEVVVEWEDEQITYERYKNGADEVFTTFPKWKVDSVLHYYENNYALVYVDATDPDLLQDIEPGRISTWAKTRGTALRPTSKFIDSHKISWNIAAVPTKKWADKVFPNLNEVEREPALWNLIFQACRIDGFDDPIAEWNTHVDNLQERVEYLNDKKYKKLHYKNSKTNLTIELPKGHIWMGGSSRNEKGVMFTANIPTEEVWTVPYKYGVNGTVSNSKPFVYNGNVIDDFTLEFQEGKIVKVTAGKGEELLKGLVNTEENSMYLGEVALVDNTSIISQMNVLFFNTLFDENASCHLAIGNAYSSNFKGGESMDKDELEKNGINQSIVHEDFMIGTDDLLIQAETADGKLETIMNNGKWSI